MLDHEPSQAELAAAMRLIVESGYTIIMTAEHARLREIERSALDERGEDA